MIRPLRQRHRRISIALGLFLPLSFVIGIAKRRPLPVHNKLPSSLPNTADPFTSVEWQRNDLFPNSAIQVRLWRERSGPGAFAVSFAAVTDFLRPDLLVYWSAEVPASTNALPDYAILLGAFHSLKLKLPETTRKSDGTLVLFSLANNEIVATSSRIRFSEYTK